MRFRVTTALCLIIGAVLAASGQASAADSHSETRTVGSVKATLSWKGSFEDTKNFRISIERGGTRALDRRVTTPECPTPSGGFICIYPIGDHPLELRDLDGDGEPEAIVEAFTGGAHCCVIAVVYRWTQKKYAESDNNFADPGYRLKDLNGDGRDEFLSADARFGYLYGSFAESVFPIQIVSFDHGKFEVTTTQFRDRVAKDTRRTKREYKQRANSRRRFGLRPALAAYVADLYLLDRRSTAKRKLHSALHHGLLAKQNRFDVGPYNRKYIRNLKHRLRRWGY